MAFVIPTAEINFKPLDNPGPGNYNIQKPKQTGMGYAPFNSTTLRKQKKKQQILPGPGQYREVQLKKVYQTQTPGNHMFMSKVERFKQTQQTNIGPTYYRIKLYKTDNANQSKIEHKIKEVPKRQSDMINSIRQQNNARKTISIKRPTNYIRIIYNNPNSTQNTVTQYVDIDFMNRNLGPGEYDINKIPQQHKRAVSWSRSKTKRFQEDKKNQLGPGQYNQQQQQQKRKHVKNNAVFSYQGVRTHFQSLLYKTNIHDVALLRQYIKYKDPIPGPGYYQSQKVQSQKPNLFQFFGSTSERFLKYNKDNQSNIKVGPGSYYVDSNLDKKLAEIQNKKRNKLTKLRATTVMQNKNRAQLNKNPGPASYYDKSKTLKQALFQKFKLGYNGEFGTRQQRFKTQYVNKDVIPGPGQYNLQQNSNMKDSIFSTYISQSKRIQNKRLDTPFGKYDVDCYDINKQLQKKKQFIQNLKKISVNKAPFQTTEKRFKTMPNQISSSPNKIENLNLQAQNADQKQVLKKIEEVAKGNVKFNSTQKRFVQKVQDYPPPGHYHKNNNIQKYSYNIKYGYKKL